MADEFTRRVAEGKAWLKFCSECAEGALEMFLQGPCRGGERRARVRQGCR